MDISAFPVSIAGRAAGQFTELIPDRLVVVTWVGVG
jgi:hypothetical protein